MEKGELRIFSRVSSLKTALISNTCTHYFWCLNRPILLFKVELKFYYYFVVLIFGVVVCPWESIGALISMH